MKFDRAMFKLGADVYPQPVAIGCGQICRARTIQERLDAILKCAEVVARFLAAVSIASYCARKEDKTEVPQALKDFNGDLSFGKFLSVVQSLANVEIDHPLKSNLAGAFKAKGGEAASANISIVALLNVRNELGHSLAGLSEARASSIFFEKLPDNHLRTVLEEIAPILELPLFLVEEQSPEDEKNIAHRLILMGESLDPIPEPIELSRFIKRRRGLYIGLGNGVLSLYPFLTWNVVKERGNFGNYVLHAVLDRELKFVTVNGEDLQTNGDLLKEIQGRLTGSLLPIEEVKLANGLDFRREWLEKRKTIERVQGELSGQIPWNDLYFDTMRWYAQQLEPSVRDENIRGTITERLFDGRDALTPKEIRQVRLLFGKEQLVRQLIGRELIDCRAKPVPNARWSERIFKATNVLESLRLAIDFFGRHVGIDGVSIDGLNATSGSADYIAMREALVNLFIHQDYEDDSAAAQIEITPDRAEFFNTGKSLVSKSALAEGGKSQARNPLLARALRLIGFAELAGSGLRELNRAWREAKRRPPQIESNSAANTFTLTLDWRELPDVSDAFWRNRLGVSLSKQEASVLLLSADHSGISIEQIASSQGILVDEAKLIAQRLVKDNLVAEKSGSLYIQDRLRDLANEAMKQTSLQDDK